MIRATLLTLSLVGLATAATAQTWEENLAAGAATTEKNHLNVPFNTITNMKTAYSSPGNWPIFENRGPIDRSPQDKPSKVLVMGSGDPNPNPYRHGPALAVIVNDYP